MTGPLTFSTRALAALKGWSPRAKMAIDRAISANSRSGEFHRPVAAFDCDMTAIYGESGWTVYNHMVDTMSFAFGDDLYFHIGERYHASAIADCVGELLPLQQSERLKHPLFSKYRRLMLGANYDRYRLEGGAVSCPWVVRSYAGLEYSVLQAATRAAIEKALKTSRVTEIIPGGEFGLPDLEVNHGIVPFPAVTGLMSLLKASGFDIVMVSGSHQLAVDALVDLARLPVDRSFGMDPILRSGFVTSELEEPFTWRSGKTEVIHGVYPQGHSLAFGDSTGDRHLLRRARDAAVVIDYANSPLAVEASRVGWAIQSARPWIEQLKG